MARSFMEFQGRTQQPFISTFAPINYEFIQQQMDKRQARFDFAAQARAKAEEDLSKEVAATDRDQQYMDELKSGIRRNFKDIISSHGGDLSAATNDIVQYVGRMKSDPFWMANQTNLQTHSKYKELRDKYGDKAVQFMKPGSVLDDVGNVRSVESIMGTQLEERSDSAKLARDTMSNLESNMVDAGIDYTGFWAKFKSREYIDDKRIRDAANAAIDEYKQSDPQFYRRILLNNGLYRGQDGEQAIQTLNMVPSVVFNGRRITQEEARENGYGSLADYITSEFLISANEDRVFQKDRVTGIREVPMMGAGAAQAGTIGYGAIAGDLPSTAGVAVEDIMEIDKRGNLVVNPQANITYGKVDDAYLTPEEKAMEMGLDVGAAQVSTMSNPLAGWLFKKVAKLASNPLGAIHSAIRYIPGSDAILEAGNTVKQAHEKIVKSAGGDPTKQKVVSATDSEGVQRTWLEPLTDKERNWYMNQGTSNTQVIRDFSKNFTKYQQTLNNNGYAVYKEPNGDISFIDKRTNEKVGYEDKGLVGALSEVTKNFRPFFTEHHTKWVDPILDDKGNRYSQKKMEDWNIDKLNSTLTIVDDVEEANAQFLKTFNLQDIGNNIQLMYDPQGNTDLKISEKTSTTGLVDALNDNDYKVVSAKVLGTSGDYSQGTGLKDAVEIQVVDDNNKNPQSIVLLTNRKFDQEYNRYGVLVPTNNEVMEHYDYALNYLQRKGTQDSEFFTPLTSSGYDAKSLNPEARVGYGILHVPVYKKDIYSQPDPSLKTGVLDHWEAYVGEGSTVKRVSPGDPDYMNLVAPVTNPLKGNANNFDSPSSSILIEKGNILDLQNAK